VLDGILIYRNMWHDVIACRWSKREPGRMEVVRANRRNFRVQPVTWTVGALAIEDPRKLKLKDFQQVTLEALRSDNKTPEAAELIKQLELRFNPATQPAS
jgi:hypothetical protein